MQSISRAVTESNDRPSDPRNREVVYPAFDPQVGNLATPINSSKLTKTLINNMPAYRQGLTPLRRGVEVGIFHGYVLLGPFAKLNPLRDTANANFVGLLAALGTVLIAAASIVLYANSKPPAPAKTITTPNPPDGLSTQTGWNQYAMGFLVGGSLGALLAYLLLLIIPAVL